LTIGGYDADRIKQSPVPVVIPINTTTPAQSLQVGLTSISTTSNTQDQFIQLMATPLVANVDSSVSQLWLPADVCDKFANAFNLTYVAESNYYLVNSSVHTALQKLAPTITMTVGTADHGASM
jgi:hypothetical protein